MTLASDWELIANYESFELVKRDYVKRHGRAASTGHAREIAARDALRPSNGRK